MIGIDLLPWPPPTHSRHGQRRWWERIATEEEVALIQAEEVPALKAWELWGMKEAVYKAHGSLGYQRAFRPKDFCLLGPLSGFQSMQGPKGTFQMEAIRVQTQQQRATLLFAIHSAIVNSKVSVGISFEPNLKGKQAGNFAREQLMRMAKTHFLKPHSKLIAAPQGGWLWRDSQQTRLGWVSITHQAGWIAWAICPSLNNQ